MSKLISVVVPIYNVEKYLERCIDSILAQTYRNIEVILVDDGSPDSCPRICDYYSNIDNRIIVIHKKNGGLSDARNKGIDAATGEYITFIDSDDYVHPKFIEVLVMPFIQENCDISFCKLLKVRESLDFENEAISGITYQYYSGRRALFPDVYQTVACAKLYNIELFETIRYPVGKINEDEATTYKLFYKANKLAVIDIPLYYYYMSPNSITRSEYKTNKLDIISILEDKLDFFKYNNEPELYSLECKRYCSILLTQYYYCRKYLPNSRKERDELFNKFKKNYKKTLNIKQVRFSSRILMLLCRLFPYLYGIVVVKDEYNTL